jgi:hypothetical protein
MCRRGIIGFAIGDAIFAGAAEVGVACAAWFCHFEEAKRDQFPNGGGNRLTMDSICDELIIRHDQLTVVLAAMARKLDLDAVEYLACGAAQDGPSW